MQHGQTVSCIGLGAMGWGIASNLVSKQEGVDVVSQVLVWNRTKSKSEQHAATFGTKSVETLADAARADVVVTCLPTSTEVAAVANELGPNLRPGMLWIDCTSGDPVTTQKTADFLFQLGVDMVDCPVSGGPDGALCGNLTAMVGGASFSRAKPFISCFAKKKIVHCGGIGAGNAVKAANNCLNVSHLVLGAEALLALAKFGVHPCTALEAINASSGRSLQTEVRLPAEVLSRKFNYGFKMGLMLKDVNTAIQGLGMQDDGVSLIPRVKEILQMSTDQHGFDADYTTVVKTLEDRAGFNLSSQSGTGTQTNFS
tara:strand:+ start:77521 stop:78459 length:939 start_codon:yes stop_codon:yes gene_type:complete